MFGLVQRRRRRLVARPFPATWDSLLTNHVELYRRLPPADRRELQGHTQVFLAEKRFEGCGGLAITDEIRVTIAATACVLLLHRPAAYYPLLVSILVYPHPFIVERAEPGPSGQVLESEQVLSGESSRRGTVVLAWDEVQLAGAGTGERNVVLHEFAHQLDEENGAADGAPALPQRAMYADWAHVLGRDYAALLRETAQAHGTLLDPYAGKSPAEFFAVATELFFEAPGPMKALHPELYATLQRFYRQDPAAWGETVGDPVPQER